MPWSFIIALVRPMTLLRNAIGRTEAMLKYGMHRPLDCFAIHIMRNKDGTRCKGHDMNFEAL